MADGTTAQTAPTPSAELLEHFCNTVDLEGGEDELGDTVAVGAWFAGRGLLDAEVGEDDVRRVVAVREGVRDVLTARAKDRDLTALDELTQRLHLRVDVRDALPRLVPVDAGVDGALEAVLAALVTAATDGSWARLKVCSRHACRWVFYDTSRNRSRAWCSMDVCGNKEKTKAYRTRRRGGDGAT